ncbi:MAG: methyltransferase domain-containing protein [Planctomycetota bacterium]
MIQNWLYNALIKKTTNAGYGCFFENVVPQSKILDIGIGNGVMLHQYHSNIRDLRLSIEGIDLNKHYLKQCQKLIEHYNLESQIKLERLDFLATPIPSCFDYVFFSMSFMLFPDQRKALDIATAMLNPGGQIIFGLTIQMKESRTLEFLKPKLKYISTIDFGKVTYEEEFLNLMEEKQLKILKRRSLHKISSNSEFQVFFTQREKI